MPGLWVGTSHDDPSRGRLLRPSPVEDRIEDPSPPGITRGTRRTVTL